MALHGFASRSAFMSFQVSGLSREQFAPLFGLSDAELATRDIVRRTADKSPGFPCRVSLMDAVPGETLLLLNYEHLPVASPYRARQTNNKQKKAVEARVAPGVVPEVLR